MPPPIGITGSLRILSKMAHPKPAGKKNLLLCFDAFGTLFTPKRPVHEQYGDVARSLGLTGVRDEDVGVGFKKAFKEEVKRNPNYGKKTGMGAEKWWGNIITNTFRPLVPPGQDLPSDLVPKLLHRFWSNEGYTLYPDVQPLLQKLRNHYRSTNGQIVVGVITNSDPRVPDVLSSLGMAVSSWRWPSKTLPLDNRVFDEWDIDFTVMSYEVGHEKPDRRIFAAAEEMLEVMLRQQGGSTSADDWSKVYVGDEYAKDVVGATGAGWNAVLIDREAASQHEDVPWLDDRPPTDAGVQGLFETSKAVGFSSLSKLAAWLPSQNS